MKLWWPHIKALYALLLAFNLSGDDKYARWFELMHEWSFAHFPDPEYGGWSGQSLQIIFSPALARRAALESSLILGEI